MEKKKDLLYEKFKDRCSDNGMTGEESGDIEMCWIIARDILTQERKQELDRAREEVIKNLIKKIEEANCDSISLELLREINLSKLTTK